MNRRQFLSTSSAGVAALALGRSTWAYAEGFGGPTSAEGFGGQAAAAQAPPVTRFEELRRGVGMFIGNGGTIGYLVNADGAIAVDSQFMTTAETCVAGLKQRAPKGIEMLINTHHHGDHTGGNKAFRGAVKKIVCQENCLVWHKRVSEQANNVADQAFADTTFGGSWSATLGDEKVWAHYHGAGHTSGDAVIFFEKANVVHGGDLLFRRVHPRIDGPAGASAVNWIKVLDRVLKDHPAPDTIFVFGHGADNNVKGAKADVVFFRDYLTAALEHVRKGISSGSSKDEITKVPAVKGFETVTAFNPRLNLEGTLGSIYDELRK
jgi:glyoxylase-like metal-dependent hydrolase (beta-lactamase superfamily II)